MEGKVPEVIRGKRGASAPRERHLGDADNTEEARFFAALASPQTTPHLRFMMKLTLATGLRRGTVLKLHHADYRAGARLLRLRGELLKNGKAQEMPLNEWAERTERRVIADLVRDISVRAGSPDLVQRR